MSHPAPTFGQLKAQVAAIRQHKNFANSRAIAIRSKGRWTGPAEYQDGDERYLIYQCDSPLAMRIALRSGDENATRLLITGLADEEIGDDILTRIKPRKLVPLDSWQVIKTLFQARTVDPRLSQHSWLADTLMEVIPLQGFSPVASGFLDAETVWPILLDRVMGFSAAFVDLAALLKWSTNPVNVLRFKESSEGFRAAATEWLTSVAGPAAAVVMQCVEALDRADALAVGLAARVLYHSSTAGKLDKACGKFEERFLRGENAEHSIVDRWAAAATEVVRLQMSSPSDVRVKQQILQRGDELICELRAEPYASLSDTSPIGFDRRFAALAQCLDSAMSCDREGVVSASNPNQPEDHSLTVAALGSKAHNRAATYEALLNARGSLLQHDGSSRERRRLERVDMALRLVRWLSLQSSAPAPQSLADAAVLHLSEGGYVDWARLSLRSGDTNRELSETYARLCSEVVAVRESQSLRFAELLRDWTAVNTSDELLVPVEQVLERVVAPIAAQVPVLVIVLDGMSVAVFRELMADTLGHDWRLLAEDEAGLRPALATSPSVTQVSRASLLCGRLTQGGQAEERSGFENHTALLKACRSGYPPVLFHKGDIQNSEDASLAASIRKEIASQHRKVVAVVVNAIDDHLAKGEQLDIRWTRDEIKVFPALLHEARSAGRTVILLSDHGHILDCNTSGEDNDGGERWRLDRRDLRPGELRISGPRVMLPETKTHIAPWSEKVRYSQKRNGYHGGASPQEMVIPIAVLSSTALVPTGWSEAPVDQPVWWDLLSPLTPSEDFDVPQLRVSKPKEKPAGRLFDPLDLAPAQSQSAAVSSSKDYPEWIKALLSSPIFEEQKKIGGRAVPDDELFARLLAAMSERGGKITVTALARSLNYRQSGMTFLLAAVQRVLNVDGFAVLNRDSGAETIELNRDLLLTQFDLV